MSDMNFGPAYDEELDGKRVHTQMDVIRRFMVKEWPEWQSLAEIECVLGYPQASVSAQLRHLRKRRFGSYVVEKQRRTTGTWEYRVRAPEPRIEKETLW